MLSPPPSPLSLMPLQSYRYRSSYRHVVNPTSDPDHISPPPLLVFSRSAQMHPNNNKKKKEYKINRIAVCPGQYFGTYDKSPTPSTSTPFASAGLGQSKIIICRTGQWALLGFQIFMMQKKTNTKTFSVPHLFPPYHDFKTLCGGCCL